MPLPYPAGSATAAPARKPGPKPMQPAVTACAVIESSIILERAYHSPSSTRTWIFGPGVTAPRTPAQKPSLAPAQPAWTLPVFRRDVTPVWKSLSHLAALGPSTAPGSRGRIPCPAPEPPAQRPTPGVLTSGHAPLTASRRSRRAAAAAGRAPRRRPCRLL